MKTFVILSALATIILCQGFDDGSYVHDTTGDFGPYYYWKLRKEAEAKANGAVVPEIARASAPVAPAPAPVQQQPAPRPVQQQPPRRFSNFQAAPAPAVRQQQRFRAPVQQAAPAVQPVQAVPRPQQQSFFAQQPQQQAAPAVNTDPHFRGLRFQFKIAAPEFNYENNHAENAYSFSSPNYSTNAQGGSYSYNAVY